MNVEYQPSFIGLFVHGPCAEGWQSLVSLRFYHSERDCALAAHRELVEVGFTSYPKTVLEARLAWREKHKPVTATCKQ